MHKKRYELDVISRIYSSKRGQVTIFIILGILLLLAVMIVIFMQKEIIVFQPEEVLPTDKGKVERFVSLCINRVGDDALYKIGLQGGYIDVPAEISQDGSKHLRISPAHVIPLWAYGDKTDIPSLDQIKQRIDRYIEENLRSCLFDLKAFQETYDVIEKSRITSNTEIVESKVLFNVHWNIEIRNKGGDVVAEIINHFDDSPVRLKHAYETAKRIVEFEMQDLKLEDITQDLIALEHGDVPVAGFEVSCKEKKWRVKKVRETLKDLLRVNLRQLKVEGTNFIEFPEELSYFKHHYVWPMGEGFTRNDMSVLFRFENSYPFAFDVHPRNGAFMKSNTLGGGGGLLSLFCLQSWKFVYNLDFPVQVVVEDITSGYFFRMGVTVHLRNNFPDRKNLGFTSKTFFRDIQTDGEFCKQRTVPMTVYTYELVENNQTGVYNREPIEDVDLSYTCLKYKCDIGSTQYDFSKGNVAFHSTLYPYCAGGILRGEKEGFKENWVRVVTSDRKEVELDLAPLHQIPLKKVTIKKHAFLKDGVGPAVPLLPSETALVTLKFGQHPLDSSQPLHEVNVIKSQNTDPRIADQQELDFLAKADYTYDLEIKVLNNDKFVGGYKGNWTVPWEELRDAESINFHIISKTNPTEEEMFDLFLGLGPYSRNIELTPEIK